MLNFIKKLFGKTDATVEAPVGKPAFNTEYVAELEKPAKPLEFHEEIRAQVEATTFPVKETKPAVKAKSNKGKKAPAKVKAEAKTAPAKKKPAPKKSK